MDHVVVTISPVEGTAVVRVYGPYDKADARREARAIERGHPGTQALARKVLADR